MNDRESFLNALAENEDDTITRLVYADWLDDRGEHEEADRQRKWPAAKGWLLWFCRQHNPESVDPDDKFGFVSYEDLIERAQGALEDSETDESPGISCGSNYKLSEALYKNSRDFWLNWSVVTGIPLPPDIDGKMSYRCAC